MSAFRRTLTNTGKQSFGASVLMSEYFGARDTEKLRREFAATLFLGLFFSAAVLALGFENIPVPSLPCDNAGRIMVGRDLATKVDGVYAGGDAVTGPATLMKAVAAGKDAATAIFARLAETF